MAKEKPSIRACSHLVLASLDVSRQTRFFGTVFQITPHFENEQFSEFVLPSGFRVAFFVPVGETAKRFDARASRKALSIGITVSNVDELYARIEPELEKLVARTSGKPKTHPWGEKSFLLIDPDGNRWEVTQTPSESGMLTMRDFGAT